jgi:uncharacterized protein RhaS with RHS repeats
MQARYYDPVAGRFLGVDPVGVDLGSGGNFGRYVYANNNPYLYVDPDGRDFTAFRLVLAVGTADLVSPDPSDGAALPKAAVYGGALIGTAIGGAIIYGADALYSAVINESAEPDVGDAVDNEKKSPEINPGDVAGKTPEEIDGVARELGLEAKGPDPAAGRGAYVDPVTGEQRILVHPDADCGPHCHVNDSDGNRLDIDGNRVPPESPEAHLPLRRPGE